MSQRLVLRVVATLVLVAIAAVLGWTLWNHYMYGPWTRDGRVAANVTIIAPDVSGRITDVRVHDNQFVTRGDILFTIDPSRFRDAVKTAQADLTLDEVNAVLAQQKLVRREHLSGAVVSRENLETARTQARGATAKVESARAALSLAKYNLRRTTVRAPSDGYITHLNVFTGDYALTGKPMLSLVSDVFHIDGYFQETKLRGVHVGDPVAIHLLRGGPTLHGHVRSIARGIANLDLSNNGDLLANVQPLFSWVRLAQRIPVRISIDSVPEDVQLAAGMTCTVIVHPRTQHRRKPAPAK